MGYFCIRLGGGDTSGNWTIEAWFKYPLSSNASSYNVLAYTGFAILSFGKGRAIAVRRSDMRLGAVNISSSFSDTSFNMATLSSGWHHIAVVGDNTTNRQTFYIDGTQAGNSIGFKCCTGAYPGDYITVVGSDNVTSGVEPWGTFDEFAMYYTKLDPAEIAAHYARGRIAENKNGFDGQIAGPTQTTGIWRTSPKALNFDGVDDYVTIGDISGAGNVNSVLFWINSNSPNGGILELVNNSIYISIAADNITTSGFTTSPVIYVDGIPGTDISGAGWHHVAIVSDTAITANSVGFGEANGTYFDGALDELVFLSRVLSQTEIDSYYTDSFVLAGGILSENTKYDRDLVSYTNGGAIESYPRTVNSAYTSVHDPVSTDFYLSDTNWLSSGTINIGIIAPPDSTSGSTGVIISYSTDNSSWTPIYNDGNDTPGIYSYNHNTGSADVTPQLYRIEFRNGDGIDLESGDRTPSSIIKFVPGKPAAISFGIVVDNLDGTMNIPINWGPQNNIGGIGTKYSLERSTSSDGNGYTEIARVGPDIYTYTDTVNADCTYYYYRVRALYEDPDYPSRFTYSSYSPSDTGDLFGAVLNTTVTVTSNDSFVNSTIGTGSKNVIESFTLTTADVCSILVRKIQITQIGTAVEGTDILYAKLYTDINNDRSKAGETYLDTATYSTGIYTFSNISGLIANTGGVGVLIEFEIAGGAAVGNTIQTSLCCSNVTLGFSLLNESSAIISPDPILSPIFTISNNTLTVTQALSTGNSINPGAVDFPVERIQLTAKKGPVTVTEVKLEGGALHTAIYGTDIVTDEVKLYTDKNKDGSIKGEDILGTLTNFSSGVYTFSGLSINVNNTSPTDILVTFSISGDAAVNRIVQTRIIDGYVSVGGANSITTITPFSSNPYTIKVTDVTPPGAITDFRAKSGINDIGPDYVILEWTAPGDDDYIGTAGSYSIKYSPNKINLVPNSGFEYSGPSATEPLSWTMQTTGGLRDETLANIFSGSASLTLAASAINDLLESDLIFINPDPSEYYYFSHYIKTTITQGEVEAAISFYDSNQNPLSSFTIDRYTNSNNSTSWLRYAYPIIPDDIPDTAAFAKVSYRWDSVSPAGTIYIDDVHLEKSSAMDDWWTTAVSVSGLPAPALAGTKHTFTVPGLSTNTEYFFAVKAQDDETPANLSPISNIVRQRSSLLFNFNMISISKATYSSSPGDVLRDIHKYVYNYEWQSQWDGVDQNQADIMGIWPLNDPLVQGRGYFYWAYPYYNEYIVFKTEKIDGPEEYADYINIPLAKGWNVIGNPYPLPVILNGNDAADADPNTGTGVTIIYSGAEQIFDDAVTNGYVGNSVYFLDNTGYTTSFYLSAVIEPWKGYWFFVHIDNLSLKIYRPKP